MAPLDADSLVRDQRVPCDARASRPVGPAVLDDREPRQRLDRAAVDLLAVGIREQGPTSTQDVHVSHETVRGAEIGRVLSPELLRPEPRAERLVPAPRCEKAFCALRPERGPAFLSRPRVELPGQRHVARMAEHRLERGRGQRRTRQLHKAVAPSRFRPAALGHCEHACDSEPDSLLAEVGIVGIVDESSLEGLDEVAVDGVRGHVAVGREFVECPSDAGRTPVQAARRACGFAQRIGVLELPEPGRSVQLMHRARRDVLSGFPRGRLVEGGVCKRLVTGRCEEHTTMLGLLRWRGKF